MPHDGTPMEPKTEMANTETVDSAQVAVSSTAVLGRCVNLAKEGLLEDGAHHKQWYLAMILKELDASAHYDYEQWGTDMGIAP